MAGGACANLVVLLREDDNGCTAWIADSRPTALLERYTTTRAPVPGR
jgi:hypothetical protein